MEQIIPSVSAELDGKFTTMDLYSWQFLKKREIHLNTEVNDASARLVCAQMAYLADQDCEAPIRLWINSPGGNVSAGLAIYDMLRQVPCRVETVGIGCCASMAAILLAAGEFRWLAPDAQVMIHQPLSGVQGQASDISRYARHVSDIKEKLAAILSAHTGNGIEDILAAMDRDTWFNSESALSFHLADRIGIPL